MSVQRRLAALALLGLAASSCAHAQGYDQITCKSHDYRYEECDADFRAPVLIEQTSDSDCIEDRTWGATNGGGIWVDQGCAGVFAEGARSRRRHEEPRRYGRDDGDRWDRDIELTCSSDNYGYNMCEVDVGRRGQVFLIQQLSHTRCIEGRSWGYNRAGVWVDQGCSGEFRIERRGR